LAVLLSLSPAASAWAKQDNAASAAASEPVPTIVTAKTLIADNKKKEVTYRTGVVVKRGDLTLYADEVVIRLSESRKPAAGDGHDAGELFSEAGGVDTIEARGGVKVVQGESTATSDSALYKAGDETIIMTGSPRLWQGPNVLTGTRIIFSITDDTITVDDPKTILYQGDGMPGPQGGKK